MTTHHIYGQQGEAAKGIITRFNDMRVTEVAGELKNGRTVTVKNETLTIPLSKLPLPEQSQIIKERHFSVADDLEISICDSYVVHKLEELFGDALEVVYEENGKYPNLSLKS